MVFSSERKHDDDTNVQREKNTEKNNVKRLETFSVRSSASFVSARRTSPPRSADGSDCERFVKSNKSTIVQLFIRAKIYSTTLIDDRVLKVGDRNNETLFRRMRHLCSFVLYNDGHRLFPHVFSNLASSIVSQPRARM